MIVGEFPGDEETRQGIPFAGASGNELTKMLGEAGLMRAQCFLTNVARTKPPGGDIEQFIAARKADVTPRHRPLQDKQCTPEIHDGIALLQQEIAMCQPNVIIACGNVALWALTGNWGITSWRGSELECTLPLNLDYRPKVIPIYSPAGVLRQWKWRPIVVQDLRRAAREAQSRELIRPDYRFIIRPDYQTTIAHLDMLLKVAAAKPFKLSVDLETRAGHTACIGLAWSKLEAICIPLMCTEREEGYWTVDEEAEIVFRLYRLLTHPNCHVIGQNFIYDAQYIFRHWHFIPNVKRDTMIAQHSCFSTMPKGLDFLSSMYAEHHVYWKDEGKEWNPKIPEDQYWTYNCKDAVITYEVDDVEQATINGLALRPVADFQQSLFYPVLRTMQRGIRIDKSLRGQFAMDLMQEIAKREQWLIDVVGYPLNPKSPQQVQAFFYEELGLSVIKDRKTRRPTANEEAMRTLAQREPILRPLVAKLLELRSLGVFLSTFVRAPLDIDDRMRCSFNIAGTKTYRFASSKNAFGSGMNLQNTSSGGEEDDDPLSLIDELPLDLPNIRKLFIPDPGQTFFDIDLASADLRIVVWESDCKEMKQLLAAGLDPYTEIAKEFYHDKSITKKDPRRQTFKSFAHGTHYLGTAKGLAERLGLSVADAEKTQTWYFDRFPEIRKWQNDLKDQVFKRHMVQNVFGYRCYIFDRIEGTLFNQIAAWIPQSTVGCLINRAYVNIDRTLSENVEILLQVHDSLAGQFPTAKHTDMVGRIVDAAQIPLPYPDPLTIPVGVKTSTVSWGDCA